MFSHLTDVARYLNRHTLRGKVSPILVGLCGYFSDLCSKTAKGDHLAQLQRPYF